VLSESNQALKRNLSVCPSEDAEYISSHSELPPEEFEQFQKAKDLQNNIDQVSRMVD